MQEDNTAIRRHIRQITGIPIKITLDYISRDFDNDKDDTITNVSFGGMSFIANDRLQINQKIRVKFPILNSRAALTCKVIWCNKSSRGYEVGLEFDDAEEVERLKMIDQISDIENYRKRMESIEGRPMNSEQAAREWITQYAGDFSAL
ncbi:MAG: PilZ domain-containing protein [Gammaproteobacteria bacterium]|nr:PilZ domain-containing protein [Gammaproteobacteria bacterium]